MFLHYCYWEVLSQLVSRYSSKEGETSITPLHHYTTSHHTARHEVKPTTQQANRYVVNSNSQRDWETN
jgi:hypothetical protein